MKTRFAAPIVLALAVALGTTGCAMISPQSTTIPYSPSDGVTVPDSGPLLVRNALIIADESGELGNFIAAIVNDTDRAEMLLVGIAGDIQQVQVPARSTVSLGVDGEDPLLFENLGAAPGSDALVSFQSGDGSGVEISVPVLDGTLPYYADLAPAAD